MRGLILAAGRGSRLGKLTDSAPKCTMKVHGVSLLDRQLNAMKLAGVRDVAGVTGYCEELINCRFSYSFKNNDWSKTNIAGSLYCAEPWLNEGTTIVSYGDIFYPSSAVSSLIDTRGDIVLAYDPNWLFLWESRFIDPFSDAENFQFIDEHISEICGQIISDGGNEVIAKSSRRITRIGGRAAKTSRVDGQYMGLFKITPKGWKALKECTSDPDDGINLSQLDMTSLFSLAIDKGISIYSVPISGPWGEVDHPSDILLYEKIYPAI
ncbi:phosphocholine cytidylyltransferase family protein [Pectobacterium carotovorum]|uniref:Phosphocholine cytidylyltransferase family protein n=1 Tax=Pectobacterium carotovorum TaxID=554 RepID=A0A419AXL6_PECCA|nr:phosphocholine cytidylyltransferase family protein [Pectobacterium carotovorum]RJL52394.1 phosphocholine cytidylyltransferase family protein [Pectobacterium carotovorum]